MTGHSDSHSISAAEQRIFEDLECWFENEVADERLDGAKLTAVKLSPDKRALIVFFLTDDEREEDAKGALEESVFLLGDRVEECLRGRRPGISIKFDRGARNLRRVEEILEDLKPGETPSDASESGGVDPELGQGNGASQN